ncbi:MAG: hypothetical protein DME86_07740, partial [Verrucomicrobia bacterium]
KIDLAPSNEDNESEVRKHLRESPFAKAAIVTTSVVTGRGLDELKRALSREFSSLEPSPDIGKPRLFVDRAFSLHGVGTVVTGTVSGGRFARGDSLRIQPRGRTSKLRQLQSHNRGVESVGPGMRAAFNLSDITVDTKDANHVRRGDVVTRADSGTPSKTVDILFLHSPRRESSRRTVKDGARVRVHYGSGNFAARLFRQHSKGGDSIVLVSCGLMRPCFSLPAITLSFAIPPPDGPLPAQPFLTRTPRAPGAAVRINCFWLGLLARMTWPFSCRLRSVAIISLLSRRCFLSRDFPVLKLQML